MPSPSRRSLLFAALLKPLARLGGPLAAVWLRSSQSVVRQGWILSPDD